jgi:alkylation response protein AidB-like acyl-CoA dehydrogenase
LHSAFSGAQGSKLDLNLSDDQQLFLDTTRKFLGANWPMTENRDLVSDSSGFDRGVWAKGADLGWTSMLVPDEYGGGSISGQGVSDLAIIAEELGRVLFPGPVLPTNIVAFALARSGSDQLAKEHLPSIATGSELAAWAVAEPGERWGPDASSVTSRPAGSGFVLSGVKAPVQDAHVADVLLVSAETPNGLTQFLVPTDAPGLTVTILEALDLTRRFCRVDFESVEVPASALVGEVGQASAAVDEQLALALALQCAETVGAADWAYETTLSYIKDRKSFGRPIGSYQALKHRMADMLLWLESSKAVAVDAANAVQFGVNSAGAASSAKAYVADRCPVIVRECLQFHGGIGYTWEHDLHFYMRRVESNAAIYGGPDYHLDRLAPAVGL